MLRRTFQSIIGTYISGNQLIYAVTDQVEVGIYLTENLADSTSENYSEQLKEIVESTFKQVFPDKTISVSVESGISPPDKATDSVDEAIDWWEDQGDYSHANSLLFDGDEVSWSEFIGYGLYRTPNNVMMKAELIPYLDNYRHLFIHEIGHNFGLRHSDYSRNGDTVSLMYPTPSDDHLEPNFEFSTGSKQLIRDQHEYIKEHKRLTYPHL